VAVPSGISVYLILSTFKDWKTYISRATVAGRKTSMIMIRNSNDDDDDDDE